MRAHAGDLRAEVQDAELTEAVARDWRSAPLERISSRAAAMCAHAEALTRAPGEVRRQDLDALRAAGLDDEALHDMTQVVALFNYYNRIADGLGIEPEPEWGEEG